MVQAVLYEGHLLYPYHRSALKNQLGYPLAALYPESFCRAQDAGDRASLEMQCLAIATGDAQLAIELCFLDYGAAEPIARDIRIDDLTIAQLHTAPVPTPFAFAELAGLVSVTAAQLGDHVWKIAVEVRNTVAVDACSIQQREGAMRLAIVSPTLVLSLEQGSFVSMVDPPPSLRAAAAGCRNSGTWPALVGDPAAPDTLLSAPIVLGDFPGLAPESPGDFFDGTDIDELLTLRVLTLGEDEKRQIRAAGGRAGALLARTESLGYEATRGLHGRLSVVGDKLRPGASVVLRPSARADIFDLALAGKRATVAAIEHDLEGRTYVAVTVDDDPGKDLGVYGHRFFFRPEELEVQ